MFSDMSFALTDGVTLEYPDMGEISVKPIEMHVNYLHEPHIDLMH